MHARHAAQHITDVHRALLYHGLAANDRARAGMVLHHFGIGVGKPVAYHLDIGHTQHQRRAGFTGAVAHRAQGHGAGVNLVIQATAFQ